MDTDTDTDMTTNGSSHSDSVDGASGFEDESYFEDAWPEFNNSAYSKPLLVEFPTTNGADGTTTMIHAQLFLPPAPPPPARPSAALTNDKSSSGGASGASGASGAGGSNMIPAVVFTHGGSQRQMYGTIHYSPTYAGLYALNQVSCCIVLIHYRVI